MKQEEYTNIIKITNGPENLWTEQAHYMNRKDKTWRATY